MSLLNTPSVPGNGPVDKESLVKFDQPVFAAEKADMVKTKPKKKSTNSTQKLPPVDQSKASSQVEDILNQIMQPREWTDEGKFWTQKVSSTPATRLDVIALTESLDTKLQQRKARETGIDPVRQELYRQTFDELIRHTTINCAERGQLLLRVRDEVRMTMDAYRTLYESAIAWGMRKALESEQGKSDLEKKIETLESDKKELERQVQELKSKCEFIEKRENERRAHDEKKHSEEVSFLKRTNQQLKTQLESILKKN
eukprot:TRINITY_DN10535_c0_g1_i1.p1 TRINITY_DN10535_c0_g1~~TRINITY_DN10535_c0_g1_i1.p1  ORF type:complete len:256 (+),score=65.79 TRINITY_DN10535_c0_g1_i1:152-919(+)